MRTALLAIALAAAGLSAISLSAVSGSAAAQDLPTTAVPEVMAAQLPTGRLVYTGLYGPSGALFGLDDIKRQGDIVEVTELLVYEPALEFEGKVAPYQITRTRFDCAKHTNHNLGGKAFDDTGAFLTYTPAFKEGPNRPDSFGEHIAAIVCYGAKPETIVTGYKDARALVVREKAAEAAAGKP